jgi:hypothetical protein
MAVNGLKKPKAAILRSEPDLIAALIHYMLLSQKYNHFGSSWARSFICPATHPI